MWRVQHCEFRGVMLELILAWADEHVSCKGVVPCIMVDHTDRERFAEICTTVEVLDKQCVP